MYLGIDFLIDQQLQPWIVEVNMGLPGGAEEYDRTFHVVNKKPSHIFDVIDNISLNTYHKPFKDYLHSLPFIQSLKAFKLWIDGYGPFPDDLHPALRLEDKWVQYQLLRSTVPIPETIVWDSNNRIAAQTFLEQKGTVVAKRRLGRGGKGFLVIETLEALHNLYVNETPYILQEYITSQVYEYVFSVRTIAFAGEFVCIYANLATRPYSNHGVLISVSEGNNFGLSEKRFSTKYINKRSWEADIWFGDDNPPYLRHNLYEDEVAEAILFLPHHLFQTIQTFSISIERLYEELNFATLPTACFE